MTLLLCTRRLSDELYAAFNGRQTSSETRPFLAAGAHDAVHEHHRAVGLLVAEGLCGSAFSLVRSMFDGCLRGLWLSDIATTEQLNQFLVEKYDPKPARILRALKQREFHSVDFLDALYANVWDVMSSYVHGGFRQIVGRLGPGFVGANFSKDDIDSLLQHANWFALLSAVELAQIAEDEELKTAVIAIGQRYVEEAGLTGC
jgi:hypothetical protein